MFKKFTYEHRLLTCTNCWQQHHIMVYRYEEGSEQFGGCHNCHGTDFIDLPAVDVSVMPPLPSSNHPSVVGDVGRMIEAQRKRLLDLMFCDRDPDSPERQPWWHDDD